MKSFYIFIILLFVFISNPNLGFSANRFWVGSGLGNWNNTSNWSIASGGASGASIPNIADIVIFDGSNTTDCNIDVNISVAGFTITNLYTGTINMNTVVTMTVAASGFSQSGGTFTGNNGNISINGPYNLAGGNFTSTSGTFQITGGFTFSSGVFNHNNGTVSFSTTQSITGNTFFYTILFVANGGTYTIASGTTISASNNVIISGSGSCTINTGVLELKGDLTLTSSSNNSVNGGSATFLFNGTGIQTINSALASIIVGTNERVCALPNVEINKVSGSLNLIGAINCSGTSWTTTAGASLVNPGTSTLNINSSVTFSGQNLTLYTIHIWANSQSITLSPATYVLTSTHNVIINGGSYYRLETGTLEILGDLTLTNTNTSAVNGGTGTFLFNGTGVQNINSSIVSLANVCALPNVEINKSSGSLNLIGIINFSGSSWNTIAGASLINAGTSIVNITKNATISGQNLSLYDIVVTGNFSVVTISAGVMWTSTHLLTFAGGGSWYQLNTGTLNAKGDILVTNTNTSNNVGGNAVLLIDGTANQTLTGSGISGGGRLPQVQINKTGGTLTLSSIISTDNNWTYIAGTVDAFTNATTVDFYKTSVIDGQGTSTTMAFYHVIFSGLISLGGNMDVNGDFNIRSGVNNRLDVTAVNNYQLNVAGNWVNNNSITATSFNQQNGKVVFDGGAAQAITLALATHIEVFYNLEMSNTSGGLTLNAPITISNNINFITGNIYSSSANILLLNNAATATGASNLSFVSGPVCKTGNQAFVFPVGKNSVYAPIAISAPSLITNQFTAEYFQTDPNPLYDVTSKDITLDHISRCEYWNLDRTSGSSNVTVTLSWDTRSCGVSNLSELKVAYWNGTQWNDKGNGGTTGTIASGTIATSAPVTAFGPFTLSSSTLGNPLPIDLLSFAGTCENTNVHLYWRTASHTNTNFYSIEYSSNLVNWEEIGEVAFGNNPSTIMHYTFIDPKQHDEMAHYRLKQTNLDESIQYSNTIVVNCGKNYTDDLFIYPNPSNGIFYFSLNKNGEKIYSIEVFNSIGEMVYSAPYQTQLILLNQPDGVYFLHLKLSSKTIIKKIVMRP